MDTKWKKSKEVLGIVSFVLCVVLLLCSVLCNPYLAFYEVREDIPVIADPKGRYEQTEAFRTEISDLLNELIRVGAGRHLSYSMYEFDSGYDYGGGWWWPFNGGEWWWPFNGTAGDTAEETAVVTQVFDGWNDYAAVAQEATAAQGDAVWEDDRDSSLWDGNTWGEKTGAFSKGIVYSGEWPPREGTDLSTLFWEDGEESWSEDKIKEQTLYFLKQHADDKNILFRVEALDQAGRPCVYSNAGDLAIGGEENLLPEGYDFLLKYEEGKTGIWLEGQKLELYGDGIYRVGTGQWRVPGYENFKVPGSWGSSVITIAAKSVPTVYITGDTVSGYYMYRIDQDLRYQQKFFRIWCIASVCGLLALAAAVWLRKPCREGKRRIGRTLGRLPFEIVGIALGGLLYAAFVIYMLAWWNEWENGWNQALLLGSIMLALGALWIFALDLRYGGKPWKNSLCGRFLKFLRRRGLKLPVQKRLAGRSVLPLFFLLGSILCGLICLLDNNVLYIGLEGVWLALSLILLAFMFITMFWGIYRAQRLAADLGHLNAQIDAAFEGKQRDAYELPADSDLAEMAQKVAGIQDGLEKAVDERMKSERMKVELVANVSHDIKTPLTSIISYVDLLREDENLPEELKDYVEILTQKSERLKAMVQDVFEVSKAASGQLPVQKQTLDLAKLLRQTLADMQEQIDAAPVSLRTQIPEEGVEIVADGQRLYRVFQNLLINALQYSLEGSRVYVRLERQGSLAVASVRNTSRNELDSTVDFTERFVRGDESRTDGGSGLGLSIAKSFTEACGGSFRVETIADLFVVTVEFPVSGE